MLNKIEKGFDVVVDHRIKRVGRTQLIRETSQKTGLPEDEVTDVIECFLKSMANHLRQAESVSLSHDGLGRFDIVEAKARKGRNLQTGEPLVIPAKQRVKFVPVAGLQPVRKKE